MLDTRIRTTTLGPDVAPTITSMNIAADAGRAVIKDDTEPLLMVTKTDGSPLTNADIRVNEAIIASLEASSPKLPILSEELDAIDPGFKRFWTVDPIDGTISFIRDIPLYAILIGLVWDDAPAAGLIDLPELDIRISGVSGHGCFQNEERVFASENDSWNTALIAHGDVSSFDAVGERENLEELSKLVPMRRGYTDGFGYLMTITGRVDLMVDVNINPWEVVPISVLVNEAGGLVGAKQFQSGKSGLIFGAPELVRKGITIMGSDWDLI